MRGHVFVYVSLSLSLSLSLFLPVCMCDSAALVPSTLVREVRVLNPTFRSYLQQARASDPRGPHRDPLQADVLTAALCVGAHLCVCM
jgi:hypothetical protein